MIRGICFGGGVGIALTTDVRICSSDARFSVPAAKLGVGYRYSGIKRLVDVVGPAFAKEIFFTAGAFTAEDARIMGLVNRVVPPAELESYVRSFASTICANRGIGEIGRDAHALLLAEGEDVGGLAVDVGGIAKPAPLQFRDNPIDEIVEPAGKVGEHDSEAVAGLGEQPFLHLVGDGGGVPIMARPE